MEVENGLINAKGYRAKYINALNRAVNQNQIVGGDVTPTVTMGGTLLHLKREATPKRFQLHRATYNGKTVLAVSNGSFFEGGEIVKFANCTNVHYVSSGLLPRGKGWYFDGVVVNDSVDVEVSIIKARNRYWMAFISPAYTHPEDLLPNQTAGEEFERIVTIGLFNYVRDVQYVNTDIYYGGGVAEAESVKDWTIRNNGGVWQVYNPKINVVNSPSPPDGAGDLWGSTGFHYCILGTGWCDLATLLKVEEITAGYLNVDYNPTNATATVEIADTEVVGTTRKWCIGQFTQGENGLEWTQLLEGETILDASQQSPSFVRYANGNISASFDLSNSGNVFIGASYWIETLFIGGVPRHSAIAKNYSGQPIEASKGAQFAQNTGVYTNGSTMSSSKGLIPTETGNPSFTPIAIKSSQNVAIEVGSTEPTSATEQGEVYAKSSGATFWTADGFSAATHTTLLKTEVEDANNASTYSASTEN